MVNFYDLMYMQRRNQFAVALTFLGKFQKVILENPALCYSH